MRLDNEALLEARLNVAHAWCAAIQKKGNQTIKEQFKAAYGEAKTWGDADKVVALLPSAESTMLAKAIQTVEDYFGSDSMPERIKFYRTLLV